MTRDEMRRALIAFDAQLQSTWFPLDKPRAPALQVGRGAKAKRAHIVAVMAALLPLIDKNQRDR